MDLRKEVLYYDALVDFPANGQENKLYLNKADGALYYWDGAAYQLAGDGSGGVTSVTASAPLASSGGATPNITLTVPGNTTTFLRGDGTFATPSGGGLTVGTTAVTSGTVGRIFFQGSGDVLQQDSTLFWDNTNKRLGVGATPSSSVRLDVRAQGALSTDVAFRVRNSADTVSLLDFQGTGNLVTRHTSSGSSLGLFHRSDVTGFSLSTGTSGYGTGNGIEVVASTWIIRSGTRLFGFGDNSTGTDGDLWTFSSLGTSAGKRMTLSKSGNESFVWSGENFSIGGNIWGNPPVETNSFGIKNGTAPSTNATDAFKMYSADITAGNAAPHFRTENGSIVKIYQETTGVGAATLVGGGGTALTDTDTFDGYTLKQIVKALRNQGLLS
jgi:hypothetical protein